jgi:multicomponent Na+:H+ antiporter subunit D
LTHALAAVVLGPLATAVIASLTAVRSTRAVRIAALAGGVAHAAAVGSVVAAVTATGGVTYALGGWTPPIGIVLVADPLTIVFLVIIAAGHLVFLLHGLASEERSRKGVWILTEILVAALSGIAVAGDLFNLFVFIELAGVASIGLIAHKQRAPGAGAGFVYLVFAALSGALFLIAVVLLYAGTGVLTIAEIAVRITDVPAGARRAVMGLLIASLGIKFGLIPFHFWQAPAYLAAGSSVAALLSGTAMNLYVYVLVRLSFHMLRIPLHIPDAGILFIGLGAVNIIGGHTLGLAERDLKRLLAYSSVAHVGYILVGIGAAVTGPAAASAAAAALLHVLFHAVMKSGLFYSGRRFITDAETSAIAGLTAAGRREPIAFGSFFLAALAIVGVPPTSGFYSKWRIAVAAYLRLGIVPVAVISLGTIISMIYYARVFHIALRRRKRGPGERPAPATQARSPWPAPAPFLVALLGISALALGLAAGPVESFVGPAAEALIDLDRYIQLVRGDF